MKRTTRSMKGQTAVIDDEAAASEQPAKKSVKKEEKPATSPEVVELQRKMAKLEAENKDALLVAREAQARVKYLENLLDEKKRAAGGGEAQKPEVEELQAKVSSLTKQLEIEQMKAILYRAVDQQKIDDLTEKVASLEAASVKEQGQRQPLHAVQIPTPPPAADLHQPGEAAQQPPSLPNLQQLLQSELFDALQPPMQEMIQAENDLIDSEDACNDGAPLKSRNIFAHTIGGPAETIPFNAALSLLRGKYHWRNIDWQTRWREEIKDEVLHCAPCNTTCHNRDIIAHLFSLRHYTKVQNLAATVSRDAFDYWMCKLGAVETPDAVADARKAAMMKFKK